MAKYPQGLEGQRAMSKMAISKMAKWPEGQRAKWPKGQRAKGL
jgi:hypothetical protein